MEHWELVARERIRDTLARYTWSGDSLRIDRLVMSFCEDGEFEVRGQQAVRGRDAIAAFIGGLGSPAQRPEERPSGEPPAELRFSADLHFSRHNLTTTDFLEVTRREALVVSYFTVFTQIGLDHMGRYRDRLVPVGEQWLIRHRFVSTDWRSPASLMAANAAIE